MYSLVSLKFLLNGPHTMYKRSYENACDLLNELIKMAIVCKILVADTVRNITGG